MKNKKKILPGTLCKVIERCLVEASGGEDVELWPGDIVMYLGSYTIFREGANIGYYVHQLLTPKGKKVNYDSMLSWEDTLKHPFYFGKIDQS